MCGSPAFVWRFSLRGACSPFYPSPSRNARNGRTATSRARHIETSHHMSKFWVREQSFREIGFSSRPRRHINSAFGSARVDILARFKRIKFRRVFLHTIQPPRAIHLSNFVGAENVSFPRHVTSRRPLVSGTATPSPPRTANMNALRLTVLAATIAYASAQQGTCEVCHLHYYHKVRPARR